jgi:hypothetical protein
MSPLKAAASKLFETIRPALGLVVQPFGAATY